MAIQSPFPGIGSGEIFLTESGTETEIMYLDTSRFDAAPLIEIATW